MNTSFQYNAFTGLVPYHLTTCENQLQARQHTQELLYELFPFFADEQWSGIFTDYRPMLHVNESSSVVMVAESALPGLIAHAELYESSKDRLPLTLLAHDARYLARQLMTYIRQAQNLVATDPELTSEDSIHRMRTAFDRLSTGNNVAERLAYSWKPDAAKEGKADGLYTASVLSDARR